MRAVSHLVPSFYVFSVVGKILCTTNHSIPIQILLKSMTSFFFQKALHASLHEALKILMQHEQKHNVEEANVPQFSSFSDKIKWWKFENIITNVSQSSEVKFTVYLQSEQANGSSS